MYKNHTKEKNLAQSLYHKDQGGGYFWNFGKKAMIKILINRKYSICYNDQKNLEI